MFVINSYGCLSVFAVVFSCRAYGATLRQWRLVLCWMMRWWWRSWRNSSPCWRIWSEKQRRDWRTESSWEDLHLVLKLSWPLRLLFGFLRSMWNSFQGWSGTCVLLSMQHRNNENWKSFVLLSSPTIWEGTNAWEGYKPTSPGLSQYNWRERALLLPGSDGINIFVM